MTKKKMVSAIVIILIEVLLLVTGKGVIPNGTLSIMILHIPVILATVLAGIPAGVVCAAIFGIGSKMIAGGYDVNTIDYLFTDPLVSVVPRLLIPIITFLVYHFAKKLVEDYTVSAKVVAGGIAGGAGSLANTFFTLLFLWLRHSDKITMPQNVSAQTVFFTNIIGANALIEMVVSVISVSFVIVLCNLNLLKKPVLYERPLHKAFQKWLLVFMVGAFLVVNVVVYMIQTKQQKKTAEESMDGILDELSTDTDFFAGKAHKESYLGDRFTIAFCKKDEIVNCSRKEWIGKKVASLQGEESFLTTVSGMDYLCRARKCDAGRLLVMMTEYRVYEERNETIILLICANVLIFTAIFVLISKLLKNHVVDRIYSVNDSLSHIQKGELEKVVTERNSREFSVLSDGINATVTALRNRMNEELKFAREIQLSVLPQEGYLKEEQNNFEVYGVMDTAKEVGGDFYDYFLIDENKLGVVIADVSGKGVPAALFMMTAKTLIKSLALSGKTPDEVLKLANEELCKNNESGMFVTVWFGVLDFVRCELVFANAGHNPPLLKRKEESFCYMDYKTYKRSIMLGIRENICYVANRICFSPSDILFLYTDGVTEAGNAFNKQYGEQRLLECLQKNYTKDSKGILETVRKDVNDFVGDEEPFDDITMVVLKMPFPTEFLSVEVCYENTETVESFVKDFLERVTISPVRRHKLLVALDEIYSNLVNHSDAVTLELTLEIKKDRIYVTFCDNGSPYNPLEQPEPDVEIPMEERKIGGLGIFLVKKIMDETAYEYKNGKNVFQIGIRR